MPTQATPNDYAALHIAFLPCHQFLHCQPLCSSAYTRTHSAPNPAKLACNTVDMPDTLTARDIMQ